MTRAQEPDSEIDYRVEGTPGAVRTLVVLRTGALATVDPNPGVTARHDVRLILVHLEGPELEDPPAYGGETPAASTLKAIRRVVASEIGHAAFALVGERAAGALTLSLAADLGDRVDRLALVAVSAPTSPLQRDLVADVLKRISADALVLCAESDPEAGGADVAWHRDHLPLARAELLPSDALTSPDGRLGLGDAWSLVLEHAAPPR